MTEVCVIGAGAAGLMAAAAAADRGRRVAVIEKNDKAGKKLFITGKGRCNLTNACDVTELFDSVISNPRFLYSSIYSFSNADVMEWMEAAGCPVKTERGRRVFPVSDHSSDVVRALTGYCEKKNVKFLFGKKAVKILTDEGKVCGVELGSGEKLSCQSVIIATGGLSYPQTGSDGDGYAFARALGHRVEETSPALVPMTASEEWVRGLSGLSLKNVGIRVCHGQKELYSDFGEMLFTHFGVSGPVILSASSYVGRVLKKEKLRLFIDLKPALTEEQLCQRLGRDLEKYRAKALKNALADLMPQSLIAVIISVSGADGEKKACEVKKEDRLALVRTLKGLPVTLTALKGYSEAVITQGGVCVKDINPSTMESRKIKGLFFAGEVIDADALTGGFNLQIAWSTGHMAGMNA